GLVAGIPRGHGPPPPPRPELLANQRVADRIAPLGGDDPAPEQVADVRAERIALPLLAVEREHVVPAPTICPKPFVERASQLLGVSLEAVGEHAVTPAPAAPLGRAAPRVVDRALHLAGRDRA